MAGEVVMLEFRWMGCKFRSSFMSRRSATHDGKVNLDKNMGRGYVMIRGGLDDLTS